MTTSGAGSQAELVGADNRELVQRWAASWLRDAKAMTAALLWPRVLYLLRCGDYSAAYKQE